MRLQDNVKKQYSDRRSETRGRRGIIHFDDILYCDVSRIGFAHIEQIPFL